jgi:hypothetical protein
VAHYDDTTLALIALGETGVTPDAEAHLADCAECRAAVGELRHVVTTGRSLAPDDTVVAPAPAVWDRIATEIGSGTATETSSTATGATAAPVAEVVSLDDRRAARPRRLLLPVAAAAAVGLIVGIGGTYAAVRTTDAASVAQPAQVMVAALTALDEPNAHGTAVMRVVSASQRTMSVTVANLSSPPDSFYEVWLMDPSNAHLVSLGVLGPDGTGSYVVPAGLDVQHYSAVDVSLQPFNGSPAHSQHSAVRGTIGA